MYNNAPAGAALAMTGIAWGNTALAAVVLIAVGLTILALIPMGKKKEWK